tara:strand:- start:438 stop:851 length:414 start_codon:yes stop_codon:yes gene_type:complete
MNYTYFLKKHSSKVLALSAIVLIYAFWDKILSDKGVDYNVDDLTPGVNHFMVANTLWSSMKISGTNHEEIMSQLRGRSDADLLKIFEEFGLKDYNSLTGRVDTWFGVKHNLVYILKQELDGDDLLDMQVIWNGTHLW